MMPLEMSCMPLFEKMGTMYGENGGTPLPQEFYYKSISTWLMKTKYLLLMWWLLTWHEKQWLWMSLIDQQVQLPNLTPLQKSVSIKDFMKGTTLFWWPWRCIMHLGVTWIISSRSVFVFSTIGDREVIYPYLFAFNFSSSVLALFFSML